MKPESDTKQRLLNAALHLIWEQSYGAVSVEQICEQAGAQKGSFYYFFASKSDLAVAAVEEYWQKLRPELDRIFSPHTPAIERLTGFCDALYERQKKKRRSIGRVCGCPFISLGSELSTQDKNIQEKSQEILERYCQYFATAIQDAAREKLIEKQNQKTLARKLYSCVMGALVEARIRNDLEVVKELKTTVLRLIGLREAKKP
jgi:TetR/AcrR family transcriptional repressor of nem operon